MAGSVVVFGNVYYRDDPMSEVLNVKTRQTRGKNHARRSRRAGNVPAILYGHGKGNAALTVSGEELAAVMRHRSKLVELKGDVNETALIREVQWDTFGVEVLHVDFTRVKAGETVDMSVSVEIRGEAPGVREGGVVEHSVREVRIRCPVTSIPERLAVNVNSLHLDGAITTADLELPPGAELLSDGKAVVVHCVQPVPEEEEEVVAGEGAEPEVIGRKAEEEEEAAK